MRIANFQDRAALLTGRGAIDVERARGGRFKPDPQTIFEQWPAFREWATEADLADARAVAVEEAALGPPTPRPRQVFAVGLNYREHAAEARYEGPTMPSIFTKFPTCLTGQSARVRVATPKVDWEVELVAVIAAPAYRVAPDDAWSWVAGLTVGQDISARDVQNAGTSPHFSLGKSFPGFGPLGPWLVTPNDCADPDDLLIRCSLNGEMVQEARTSEMVLSAPDLIAHISSVCPLLPGDVIFTGTPAGVGNRRNPPRYLQPGDELAGTVEGIGTLRTSFVAGD
jgi:2-keto-4-pentenoate hydratase/2-oxohepta-3-ene-1,7-dioic acid hydratase in catechol pathway